MKYYGVCESRHGDHVKELELRETAKFLIDDKSGSKFKKVDGEEYLATNRKYSNWTWTGYDIYPIDHEKPLKIIDKTKKEMIGFKIKKEAEKRIQSLSYNQYLELAKFLNITIN